MSDHNNKFTFVVSDESVNKYGYRVLTSGIDLEEFERNPVMFFNHHRSDDWTNDKERLPVGRWENLRVDEDNRLLADAVIDTDDELGRKMVDKINKDMLNSASIGIQVVELSEDKEDLLSGQQRPTIKRSVLQEISIVDIPANSNAMRLSFAGSILNLSNSEDMEKLNNELPKMETLGANLSQLLDSALTEYAEANELSREDAESAISEASGVSVSEILDESLSCPTLEALQSLSEALGTDLNQMIESAKSDGCEYVLEEEEEEQEEEIETSEDLRNTFNSALSNFVEGLKGFKIIRREGTEAGKLSHIIQQLKADLSSFDNEKEKVHTEDKEELSSTIEILKAELDLLKEKTSANQETIEELKKKNKAFIAGATKEAPKNEEAPLSQDKEEIKEITKEERQVLSFTQLANKHLKKKKN